MNGSVIIDFGWFGFGAYAGLFPGVCLGPVKVMWVRGTLEAKVRGYQDAMARALSALAVLRGRVKELQAVADPDDEELARRTK